MSDPDSLRRLREEIAGLVRDLPGPLSRISARLDDSMLEITWQRPPAPPAAAAPAPVSAPPALLAEAPEAGSPVDTVAVVAPLVGTFYRASEPHARPFVQAGDEVVAGQTVAIIESMKLMNHIQSEWTGIVTEVCAEDGAAVEYDQPLLRIKTLDPN